MRLIEPSANKCRRNRLQPRRGARCRRSLNRPAADGSAEGHQITAKRMAALLARAAARLNAIRMMNSCNDEIDAVQTSYLQTRK